MQFTSPVLHEVLGTELEMLFQLDVLLSTFDVAFLYKNKKTNVIDMLIE